MTKIFYDTEFLEDGKTIELISIGMITEHGDTYYAVNSNMPWHRIIDHPWLMENVIPHIPKPWDKFHPYVKNKIQIAEDVKRFVTSQVNPKLWAWYGAYDHVVLCQLFGSMIDLPQGFPMWTNDLKQEVERRRRGNSAPILPNQLGVEHDALNDAMWVKDAFFSLISNNDVE